MSVTHISLFKFRDTATPEQLSAFTSKILQVTETCLYEGKKYIVSGTGGCCKTPELMAKGFQHGYVATLETPDMLKVFYEDPVHTETINELKGMGIVEDMIVFDFVSGAF